MAGRVDIDGHPTWVEDRGGQGAPLLLLHGGLGNSDDLLNSIGRGLSEHFRVVAFDRRGHGYTADTDAEFHYEDMATETVRVLEEVVGGPAHLVGWSDGGIVALLVALRRPDLVNKLVAIGANYHFDGNMPVEMEAESPVPHEMGNAYIQRSPDGAAHLDVVMSKSFKMFSTEPTLTTADIARISRPVLVVVGDDDMVALPHTVSLYEALPEVSWRSSPERPMGFRLNSPRPSTASSLPFLQPPDRPGRSCRYAARRRHAGDSRKARQGTPETGAP